MSRASSRWAAGGALAAAMAATGAGAAPGDIIDRMYASASVQYSKPGDASIGMDAGRASAAKGRWGFDEGVGLIGAVGYEWPNGLRTEVELGLRENSWDEGEGNLRDSFGEPVPEARADGSLRTATVMVNALVRFDHGAFNSYVGGGTGVARHEQELRVLSDSPEDSDARRRYMRGTDNVIAFQAMAGVGIPISAVTEVRLGYRYLHSADLSFAGDSVSYRGHSAELGLLFNF